ncbi:MAG: hypothetical protein JJU00_00890 [Opitutales bacterium]|nr:hypothetical protein [Opitutales bacterium]
MSFVLFGLSGAGLAAQTYSVTGTHFVGYSSPGYVIDADRTVDYNVDGQPFTNVFATRWYLPVEATGTVSGGSSFSYRMAFSLVDTTTGDLVDLENINTGATVQRIFSASSTNASHTYTANIVVASGIQLDPHRTYRVRAIFQSGSFIWDPINETFITIWSDQASGDSFARSFIHFKGPWGADIARNVVTRVTSQVHTRRYALQNVPGQDTFSTTVNYTVYRYDEPHVPTGSDTVSVRVHLALYDDSDPDAIPLETATFTDAFLMLRHSGASPPAPVSIFRSFLIEYKPTVQLDSVNRTYRVEATVEHLEIIFPAFWKPARTVQTPLRRLIHLNGSLSFGSIETTLDGLSSVSVPGSVSGGLNNTTIAGAVGTLNGGAHTYGPGTIDVSVNPAGDAFIRSPSTVTLNPPSTPDRDTIGGVAFDRGPVTLSDSGAEAANLEVILPAGMGVAVSPTTKQLSARIDFTTPTPLNQNLQPVMNQSQGFPFPRWVVEESKPVAMEVSQVNWDIHAGTFHFPGAGTEAVYVRREEYAELDSLPVPAIERLKRSNESYYRSVSTVDDGVLVRAGHMGGAEMSARLNFESATGQLVVGHFPYNAYFVVREGVMEIEDDRIVSSASFLHLAQPEILFVWSGGCSEPNCDPGGGGGDIIVLEAPVVGGQPRLRFSEDGGLYADVQIPSALDLQWGYIPSLADHAHRVQTPFAEGKFVVAGHFIHGGDTLSGPIGQFMGAGSILLSGVNDAGQITERPEVDFDENTPYQQGRAQYAGLNFTLGPPNAAPSGLDGRSLLGGEEYGPYALKNRSKYYIRYSGVSGIHDKVPTAPEAIEIYGYDITLTNFGLAFLSNKNVDSRTSGSIDLPYPSDIEPEFDRLTFLCNGALDQMDVAEDSEEQTLAYWLAPIEILAMAFASGDDCDVGEGYLTLGVNGYASHVKETLHGTLGVFHHGNLIPKEFSDMIGGGLTGLDSRLKMPTKTTFRGPLRQTTQGGFEEYILTPVADAYFDNTGEPSANPANAFVFTDPPDESGHGFINLAGRLKVSFFEAMQVHIQTSSNKPPADGNPPGNWGSAVLHVANGQWPIGGSTSNFFEGTYHDPWNRGFPDTDDDIDEDLDTYRTSTLHYPFVRQSWLGGAIVLKYKVKWNSTTRSFRSLDSRDSVDPDDPFTGDQTRDFVILQVDHRLKYLSAERAELTFGASYDGLPTVNLTNIVVNQIDEATGVFQAVSEAGLNAVFNTVNGAIDELAMTLNDNLRAYLESIIDDPVDVMVNTVYDFLHDEWNDLSTGWQEFGVPPDLDLILGDYIQQYVFDYLDPGVTTPFDQAARLVEILTEVEEALIILRDQFLATNPSGELAAVQSLCRELIKVLSEEVDDTLGSLLGAAGADQRISELLDPHLEFAKPTVAQIHAIVSDLTEVVVQIRGTLDNVVSFDFRDHLADLFAAANAEIDQVKDGVLLVVMDELDDYGPPVEQGLNFLARDPEEVKLLIKNTVYDFVLDTVLISQVQVAIKQRLQDVNTAIRQGIDNTFGEVNALMKEALVDFLVEVDDSINGALGSVSDTMGSGSLQGYAIFNGDAMRKVRIDGEFELKIPDETSFKAFLEINQYTSIDEPPGCVPPLAEGEAYTEVEIGALDVGVDFLVPDLRVNVSAKFAMKSGGGVWGLQPDGFGGSFAIASGEISFEAFTITDFAVGIMFSSTEAYVSAALGLRVGEYGAKGGVFFGRTCTLEPIELWDPLVASALGEPDPSFTGAYVYAEVHIPVSEVILGIPATCLFKVTANAGVGFFYFVEGPTYGARLGLGVTGEVLCLLTISGRVDMVGARVGGVTRLKGKGRGKGELGPCSFCIKFDRSIEIETEVGSDGSMSGKGGPS